MWRKREIEREIERSEEAATSYDIVLVLSQSIWVMNGCSEGREERAGGRFQMKKEMIQTHAGKLQQHHVMQHTPLLATALRSKVQSIVRRYKHLKSFIAMKYFYR